MEILLMVYAGVVGACVGSFLNVCVYRWPNDLSVVSPPSSCPACGTRIRWYDNVPVLGWLWLRGRCRACGNGISIQYPLVELVTALLWVMAVWRFGWDWQALATALFFTILLGIALSDAATYIIPDQFTIGGTVLGLALSFAPGGIEPLQAVIGAAVGFGVLWGGDIKMMAMVGAFLGPWGVLLTLFLGALFGSLIFAPISFKTGKLVPFGIFLALGAAITEPFGQAIIDWYVRSFLGGV
jgi:leader peptidase (prepilin peptidase)/N-methyltransferase